MRDTCIVAALAVLVAALAPYVEARAAVVAAIAGPVSPALARRPVTHHPRERGLGVRVLEPRRLVQILAPLHQQTFDPLPVVGPRQERPESGG